MECILYKSVSVMFCQQTVRMIRQQSPVEIPMTFTAVRAVGVMAWHQNLWAAGSAVILVLHHMQVKRQPRARKKETCCNWGSVDARKGSSISCSSSYRTSSSSSSRSV